MQIIKTWRANPWLAQIAPVIVFILLTAGIMLAVKQPQVRHLFSMEHIEALAGQWGAWGPFVFILAGAIMPLGFLPRWPLCVAAGLLYGVFQGALLATAASLVGAWLQFFMARAILPGLAKKLLAHRKLALQTIPARHAFLYLFLLRAFPLSNFVLTNLLAGTLDVRTLTYLGASFLGMLPSSITYAALGKAAKSSNLSYLILAISGFAILTVGAIVIRRRWKSRNPPA
jgi:uncharacterized membrane protein YdjX (TVP38/TMEM64 family)